MEKPVISICIPCYGRVDYVRNTLKSIYEDNRDVSLEDFEIIISDNDPMQKVAKLKSEFNYPNFYYQYTKCEGFMNSYYVLTYAHGQFLKLHNSQVTFRKGALKKLLKEVLDNVGDKPLIFYTNGLLYKSHSLIYSSFDTFFNDLSYWPSWSNGFAIWKQDLDKLGNINLNKLFPHTSLFITQYDKQKFILNDNHLFDTQRVKGRSGHNKFEAFTVEFPSIIDYCYHNALISQKTKKHIIYDIMTEYLPTLLFNKYIAHIENYEITNYKSNIEHYFPAGAYWITWLCVVTIPFKILYRKIKMLTN